MLSELVTLKYNPDVIVVHTYLCNYESFLTAEVKSKSVKERRLLIQLVDLTITSRTLEHVVISRNISKRLYNVSSPRIHCMCGIAKITL